MNKSAALIILAAVLAYWAGAYFNKPKPVAPPPVKQTVYERVMTSGLIRCGYTPGQPGLVQDAKTGQLSGIYYDTVDQLGHTLGLKVQFVEKVAPDKQAEGLQAGRYDMMCSPVTINGQSIRAADFSIPLYYNPVHIWGSPQNVIKRVNGYSTKIAVPAGDQAAVYAAALYPKAQILPLPKGTPIQDVLLQVTTGKADIAFADKASAHAFMQTHKDSLTLIEGEDPVASLPVGFMIKTDEYAFKQMLDNALRELDNTGMMDAIITRHDINKGDYLREPKQ